MYAVEFDLDTYATRYGWQHLDTVNACYRHEAKRPTYHDTRQQAVKERDKRIAFLDELHAQGHLTENIEVHILKLPE